MFGWANRWPSWPRATYSNQVLITSSCAANSQRNCQPFDRPFLRRSAHGAAPAVHAVQRHVWVDLVAKTASSEQDCIMEPEEARLLASSCWTSSRA